MLTNYTIAKFNAAAYAHGAKGPEINGWKELTNSDQTNTSNAGYYGIAFINEDTKTIAIASSGTGLGSRGKGIFACIKNLFFGLYADFQIFMGKTPYQFTTGTELFIDSVLSQLGNKVTEYQFVTTGHSLGAVLSNLINVKLTVKNLKVTSINIDSPGSKLAVQDYINTQKLNLSIHELVVKTYNAPPNLVNATMPEIGDMYEFQLPIGKNSIGEFFGGPIQSILHTVNTHYFSNILHFAYNKDSGDFENCVALNGPQRDVALVSDGHASQTNCSAELPS